MELEQLIEDILSLYPEEIDKEFLMDIFGTKEEIYENIKQEMEQMFEPDFLEGLIFHIHNSLELSFGEKIIFKDLKSHTKFLQELIHTMFVHDLIDSKDLEFYLPKNYDNTDRVVIY